jgi:hypothetical protein
MPEVSMFSDDSFTFNIQAAADIEYLTPQEIGELLKVSVDTVVRKFEHRRGVLDLGSSESRFTRRYRVLRIPRTVLEAYVIEAGVS